MTNHRNGLLSLTIHGAQNLHSNTLVHPLALIRLPACTRVYSTRPGLGSNPVWEDEFDLVVSCSSPMHDDDDDDTDAECVIIDVIDHRTGNVIGRTRLAFDAIAHQPKHRMQLPLNEGGTLVLTACWTTQSPSYEKRGRFLISEDEAESNSCSEKSIDQLSASSSSSSSSSSASSQGEGGEEISATASTNTNLTNVTVTAKLTSQSLLDRRSSSNQGAAAALQSVQYSFPLLEDTYTKHSNRHVASFLPTLTTRGLPFWHSTGRHGLLYDDSTTFDDRNFLNSTVQSLDPSNAQSIHTSVCEIRVWSRDFIHGIQITYAFGNGSIVRHVPGPKHVGRVHTTEHVLKLHHSDGEYVIGVEGTYREWVETLTIITNKRAHTFGGNVDARATKWRPAGSPKLPTSFRCDVPPGHRVVAFQGGYGVHLHNIGVAHAPIAEGDLKRKEGLFSNIKKKFSHTRLDTLAVDH